MKSKLALSGSLALALACAAMAQEAKPGLQLTDDQLLRQLDSFNPQTNNPLTRMPASVAEAVTAKRVPAGSGALLGETIATTSAVAGDAAADARKPKGATEINADAVEFDQKKHQAVFTGNVVVADPEFDLSCKKLTAYLKNEKGGANADAAAKDGNGPKKGGGLERAVAEGDVVISQEKLDADGKLTKSVGRAARADYSATTGEMVLSGSPEVEQGTNTVIATDPGTKMYMKRDGKMRVEGPSTMIIRDQGGSKQAR